MAGRKLVYGVGTNDLDYPTQIKEYFIDEDGNKKSKLIWFCPFYNLWKIILKRCYSPEFKLECPTYIGVTCCEEWHLFSNFRAWMIQQDWEGKQIDKDILVEGNKVYSPEACRFVSQNINKFVLDSAASRGEQPIGVTKRDRRRPYTAKIGNPFNAGMLKRGSKNLGSYFTAEEAHLVWATHKLKYAYELVKIEKPIPEIAEVLITKFTKIHKAAEEAVKNLTTEVSK